MARMSSLVLLRNMSGVGSNITLGQRTLSLAALRSVQGLSFVSRAKVRGLSVRAKKAGEAQNGAVETKGITVQDPKNVIPVELQKEASESYLAYAMSVTVGRALPDVRDGLKPVHRRILYAMHELGLSSKKPFKKCARVVGEVLGKFHPHGDAAVYDAMVRLAQSFSLRSPLISGHGNFGSLDGDPAAAMRYTECRLEPLSEAMLLADLDLQTVNFMKNFDGSQEEPYLMPARLPNLLINGASGIAVGMATSIPPHNLSEVVDALCALIKNPNVTVQELMQHLPAPDFPTGGVILGSSGILGAYSTGRGQFIVRGKAFEECDQESGRQSIVITEIPYGTNKAALVAKIASLVNNKALEGVSDVRDESDRTGTRVVVELKKGIVPGVVLNNLYRYTSLQTRFSCNMVGILNEQPSLFGLKELLEKFLAFRCDVVERRAKFELKQAEEKDHLLQGFLKGLVRLDDVVKTLRGSKDAQSALQKLEADFGLSKVQAEGILSMPLRRITSLERGKIEEEHSKLLAQVKDLQTLLSSKQRILQVVEKEALALKKEFGTPRRTLVEEGHDGRISDMDVVANDETLLTLSERGYIKRMQPDVFSAQRRGTIGKSGAKIKSNDGIVDTFVCRSHDHILLFSDKGVVYSLRAYQVPESSRNTAGVPIVQILSLPVGERITSMFPLSEFQEDKFLVMLTSQGYIKRTPLAAFSSIRPQGIVAIHLTAGDELRWVRQATELDNIFIGTQGGMVVQIPCGVQFRAMHRSARGMRAMRLRGVDRLAAIDIVPGSLLANAKSDSPPWLLLITENGIAKRVPVADFPVNSLNRIGVIGSKFQLGDRLASLHVVGKEDDGETSEQVVVGTVGGRFNRFRVRDVPVRGRMAIGVRLMKLDSPDKVKSVALVSTSDSGSGSESEVVEAAEPAEV